ncbi:MAG: tRNA (adenosine(37)-N6)-threonylcarbamoyltransferase complex transferase subunit TsaD [Verrucomicrobiota bacterium]
MPLILAIETSCDETAVAILDADTTSSSLLASEIASQIDLHQPFGGIVPEIASRSHNLVLRPLIESTLAKAHLSLPQIDAFAATAGPGLASSLLVGNTTAKSLALASKKPFLAINHLEGHLLSPFLDDPQGVQPSVALIVSGGHTLLVHLRHPNDYQLLGQTRDDAAGEAFDKVAKMLNLPYPGGPEIDRLAKSGNPAAYDFPRSMIDSNDFAFSFSGLKTAMFYTLKKIPDPTPELENLAASFQEAVVDVLVSKTIAAAQHTGESLVTVSGGVSCNSRLRNAFTRHCQNAGLQLKLAPAHLSTDNAAMIAFAAAKKLEHNITSSLTEDINPNLPLVQDSVPTNS